MTSIKTPSIRTTIFLALGVLLSTVALVDAAASSGCGTKLPSGYTPGGDSVSATLVTKDGTTRSYLIYIPTAYATDTPAPLIFNFHGRASSGAEQQKLSRMNKNAQNKNSIVIFPEGIDHRWQGDPDSYGVDDISFVDQMISYFQSNFCIDTSRIYASGQSNGGGLTAKLACDPVLSKKIAAFAPVAGAYYTSTSEAACSGTIPWTVSIDCNPGRAVPILEIHGSADNVIAYNGGPRRGWCLPAIPHYMNEWSVREGHGLTNKTTSLYSAQVKKYQWGEADGVLGVLTHYWVSGLGHEWPYKFGDAAFNATAVIMNFFEKWSLDSDTLGKATFPAQSALPSGYGASASIQVSSASDTKVSSTTSMKAAAVSSSKVSSTKSTKASSTSTAQGYQAPSSSAQGYQVPSNNVQAYQASPSSVQAYQVSTSNARGYQASSSNTKIASSKTKSTSKSSKTEASTAKSSSKTESTIAKPSSAAPSAYTASSGKIACPAANNTYYNTGSSSYVIECGIDHAGGDMAAPNGQHSGSLEDCIAACEARSDCVDVSYVRGGGACYLKSSVGKEVPNSGVIGAKKTTTSYAGAPSSSNKASSIGKVNAAAAYDAPKSSSASQAASSTAKASVMTTTVTKSSSKCSSKSSSSLIKANNVAAYGVGPSSAASQAAATSTAAPICPASNGTVFQDPTGKHYTVFCGYDTTGPVIGDPKYALGSFGNCINACGSVKSCVGVAYNGACYFKSANGQLVRSDYTAQHNIRAAILKT